MDSNNYKCSNNVLTIYWDQTKCVNSGLCHYYLRRVFDPTSRPWINIDGAATQEIISTIEKCPTGALSYELHEVCEEAVESEINFG